MRLFTCGCIIFTIWTFAVCVTLPYCIYMYQKYFKGKYYCEEFWPTDTFRLIYGGFTAFTQFILPFFIIAFCYVKVSVKLNDRARAKPGAKNSRKEEMDRERKKRTNRMLIAMVSVFGVCWFALNVVNLLNDVDIHNLTWKYYYLVFFASHALAMSSTCYNPFLYAWLNDNFRKEFKQVLPCFRSPQHAAELARQLGWKGEKTANAEGNETCQETLLPSSSAGNTIKSMADFSGADLECARSTFAVGKDDNVEIMLVAFPTKDKQTSERSFAEETAMN